MKQFLIVFDRQTGRLVELREFEAEEEDKAFAVRFERELAERSRPNIEVVLLGAESLEQVKTTHARYFFREPGFKVAIF